MTRNRNKNKGKGRKKKEEDVDFEDEPLYCICRSSDISRFMIGCDKCEEWYHGDCINVTAKQANIIKTFYCHLCRRKDPTLEIEYKGSKGAKKKPKKRRLSGKQSQQTNHSNGATLQKRGRGRASAMKSEIFRSDEDEDIDDEATDDEMETAGVEPDDEEPENHEGIDETSGFDVLDVSPDDGTDHLLLDGEPGTSSHPGNSIISAWCGECDGCRRHRQCGKCEICREARRHGCAAGQRGLPKCRLMQCVNPQASPPAPPVTGRHNHRGSAATSKSARMTSDMYGTGPYGDRALPPGMKDDFDASLEDYPTPSPPRRYINDNLNKQQQRRLAHHSPIRQQQGLYTTGSSPPDHYTSRHQRYSNNMSSSAALHHPRQRGGASQLASRRMRGGQSLGGPGGSSHMAPAPPDFLLDHGGNEPELSDSDEDLVLPDYSHCLGPACIMPARPGNKFCSEECASKQQNNSRDMYYRNVSNSRYPGSGSVKEVTATPYNLPYPDHLYCKHHRYFNWHNPSILTSSSTLMLPSNSMSLLRHPPATATAASVLPQNSSSASGLVSPGGTPLLHLQPSHHSLVSANNANATALTAQDHAAMSTAAAMAAMAQGGGAAEDYYTICETDNLEINWPQDTVAGAVTG